MVGTSEEAAAKGIRSGTDLNCGDQYNHLVKAVQEGLVSEQEVDVSLKRLMMARMKLGMFDPMERVPWSSLSADTVRITSYNVCYTKLLRANFV